MTHTPCHSSRIMVIRLSHFATTWLKLVNSGRYLDYDSGEKVNGFDKREEKKVRDI